MFTNLVVYSFHECEKVLFSTYFVKISYLIFMISSIVCDYPDNERPVLLVFIHSHEFSGLVDDIAFAIRL